MWALDQIDRFLCLGGHDWVLQCLAWYHSNQELMQAALPVIASVHGPMQCMLKGVCAQCFQWQVDPHSGERTKAVFACSWQDQPAEFIDQSHLKQRHDMNKMQRQLIDLWFSLV